MQFGPDTRTRTPRQQAHRFAAVAESQHEQPRPAILAAWRVAHHRTAAVVDLSFFSGCREDNACRFWKPGPSKLANEALHRLVASRKALIADQILPDGLAIAPSRQPLRDQLRVGFRGTRGPSVKGRSLFSCKRAYKVGGNPYGRF